jgi:hypothetical protein
MGRFTLSGSMASDTEEVAGTSVGAGDLAVTQANALE